ncbi:MAG: OB-fold domain-containing protein [Solirubrobacterales bacterium]
MRRLRDDLVPANPGCPVCGATERSTVVVAPHGRVYSWVVVHRSLQPEFAEELPYVVATVELDDGPRVFARLLEVEIDRIEPEMGVSAVFYTVGEQWLLGFAPDAASNDSAKEGS